MRFCLDEKQNIPVLLSDMDIIMYLQLLEHINIHRHMLIMVARAIDRNTIK
jgi:hypothetical protein